MSYIIPCTSPFLSIKLTQYGRQQLASGMLNFSNWAAGDSEVNYAQQEDILGNSAIYSGFTTSILKPKDQQPDIESYVSTATTTVLNTLNSSNIRVVQAIVNNESETRGFFSASTGTSITLSGNPYITISSGAYTVYNGSIAASAFVGSTALTISGPINYTEGDWLLIQYDSLTGFVNSKAYQYLWYKIQASGASINDLILDRPTPNLASLSTTYNFIIYPQGEVKDAFGLVSPSAYWDTGTLTFNSSCNIAVADVPVWNMNNVWQENLAGMSGTTSGATGWEGFDMFGSYGYLPTMNPYLQFDLLGSALTGMTTQTCQGISGADTINKSLSIIHYTNYSISNFYGEFFYIDNTTGRGFEINIPDLMYHRFGVPTGSGTTMGMRFIATGSVQTVGLTQIQYYNLIEDPALINSGATPMVVGFVYPQLKIVVFFDEEIVAAMSYKSNRNWTLPPLTAALQATPAGVGVLQQNQTMYLTYALVNTGTTGFTSAMPCQKYTKVTNMTNAPMDVNFKLETTGELPYMRKIETPGYDGLGFYATNFQVIFQIMDDTITRPYCDAWSAVDLTTTAITITNGKTISPTLLESQNPAQIGFMLTSANTTTATTQLFNVISLLDMTSKAYPDRLQFGDERFFYGNLDCYIGAAIFKTIFTFNINSAAFTYTSNPTWDGVADIMVSEIGIYDNNGNLVIIGKLSEPVALMAGQTIQLELSLDF